MVTRYVAPHVFLPFIRVGSGFALALLGLLLSLLLNPVIDVIAEACASHPLGFVGETLVRLGVMGGVFVVAALRTPLQGWKGALQMSNPLTIGLAYTAFVAFSPRDLRFVPLTLVTGVGWFALAWAVVRTQARRTK